MAESKLLSEAADLIKSSAYTTAFTGAGISVESGIPPFRGEKGLWNKYDPQTLELGYFHAYPGDSWKVIVEIFYEFFGSAKPNKAHQVLAQLEKDGYLHAIITQNIDNLHYEAGNKTVYEFHGNAKQLVCTSCNQYFKPEELDLTSLPVKCISCFGLVKPDFIFFGEGIPHHAYKQSVTAAEKSEVMIVIGTTGEVMPAGQMPVIAKSNGARIIEVNPEPSNLTRHITDIHLKGSAAEVMFMLEKSIYNL
jgi:NAD-dependent deacetylase